MEKRQLNFNQPLLSVRRGSSVAAQPEVNKRNSSNSNPTLPPFPYYRSELKSGPIRNPGAVPFQWEQMPGTPKDDNEVIRGNIQKLPVTPKLPPGRIVNHEKKAGDKAVEKPPNFSFRSQAGAIPSALETSTEEKVPSESDRSEKGTEDKDISSSDDENVTFVDAPETLSRTESFYNCSVSGVSGVDDPHMASSAEFTDPQTREFMMGRFLPAAKAVASETPPFAPRKNSATREKPQPVKDVIKWKKQPPQYTTLSHNVHGEVDEVEDDEDEDEFDETHYKSAKLCGLLPRFCLLNPIPGIRDHARVRSPARSVRTKPPYVSKSEKKDLTYGQRIALKRVLHQHASANEFSKHGVSGGKSILPLNEGSPLAFVNAERKFLHLPQERSDLRTNKLDLQKYGGLRFKDFTQRDPQEANNPPNPAMEKTLYVDSEHMEQSRNSNSSSSDSRGRNPSVDYSLHDMKSIAADNEKTSQSKCSDAADSITAKSFQDLGECFVKDLPKHQDVNLTLDVVPQQKPDFVEADRKCSPVLAPLLPKSPSESWLSRTLPSIPSKNASPKPYLGNLALRSSPVDPRRDRLVKTLKRQHIFFGPDVELAPILEN